MKAFVFFLFLAVTTGPVMGQLTSSDLFSAVKEKNIVNARACLDAGVSANSEEIVYLNYSVGHDTTVYETRVRVLYYAVKNNDTVMARLLLEHGASPNKGRWLGRDTTEILPYRYDRGGFNDIISAVVEGDDGGRMRKLLHRYDAKTWEYQTNLGMHIWQITNYVRTNSDSLAALHRMLSENPDQIDFPDNYWLDQAVSACILDDVLSGLRYIVTNLHPDLTRQVWMIPGMNFLSKTWREEEFAPFKYVFYGDNTNIELIEYVMSLNVLTEDQINKGLYQNAHLDRSIRKYYQLKAHSETPEIQLPENAKKKARLEKKMNKLYNKVQKKHPSV
jgi:ankyrin repeat protein